MVLDSEMVNCYPCSSLSQVSHTSVCMSGNIAFVDNLSIPSVDTRTRVKVRDFSMYKCAGTGSSQFLLVRIVPKCCFTQAQVMDMLDWGCYDVNSERNIISLTPVLRNMHNVVFGAQRKLITPTFGVPL